jgi:tRNA threonylcarbamoyl adenosine modification protein (Sua5/YciO/YrdC/YwlC family)
MPIAVLVASLDQATSVASMSGAADRLARRFWPGPLTIVMDRRGGDGTVGVRWPDHDFIRALARRVGPLAVTSANRHGEPTPATAREAAAALIGDVALVVDGGRCDGLASTVVDATGSGIAILRAGPIAEELIRATALR